MSDNDTTTYDGVQVDIIERESYRGTELAQIESAEDDVTIEDQSGNPPWVETDELGE